MSSAASSNAPEPRRSRQQPVASAPASVSCPKCGASYPATRSQAGCPRCLMGLALQETCVDQPHVTRGSESSRDSGGLPRHFGRYTIIRRLGQGAMGVVYLAQDTELDRLVALKVPLFGKTPEQEVFQRFQREVRAAAALQHPSICPIHDVGQIEGVVYMTMAYIEGQPLAGLIDPERPLPVAQAVALVHKLALALEEAHRCHVIHRDLKPANVLLDRRGEPIITDFGLARRNDRRDLRVTRSGALVGTPAYLSPEQLAGEGDSPQTDIYSLGVILYELLTGRLPFEGELMEVLTRIARDEPPPPSKLRPEVSASLDEICRKAMAKSRADRYPSMAALASALADLQVFTPDEKGGRAVPDTADHRRATPGVVPASVGGKSRAWQALKYGGSLVAGCSAAVLLFVFVCRNSARLQRDASKPAGALPPAEVSTTADRPDSTPPASASAGPSADEALSRLVTGRYLCFVENDWAQGLRLLADSSSAELRDLAALDLRTQDLTDGQAESFVLAALQLGDGWRQLAERDSSTLVAAAMRQRAALWYRRGLSGVGDPQRKAAVERFLAETDQQTVVGFPAADPVPPSAADRGLGSPASAPQAGATVAPSVAANPPPAPTPAAPTGRPAAPAMPAAKAEGASELPAEAVSAGLFAESSQELEIIGEQRRALLSQLAESVKKRDFDLRDRYLKATSDYARLARLSEEATAEYRAQQLQLNALQRQASATNNALERLSIEQTWKQLFARQEYTTQRLNMLATESRGAAAEISKLEAEIVAIRRQVQQLAAEGEKLVDRAFWLSHPTGWLNGDQYLLLTQALSRILGANDDSPEWLALRALARANAGQLVEAVEEGQRAVQLNKTSPLGLAALGYAQARSGKTGDGISVLTRAIRLAPNSASLYLLRGLTYQSSSSSRNAFADFEKLVDLAPQQPWGHCYLSLQYSATRDDRLRNGEKALAAAQRACALANGRVWVCLDALASAYAELGRFDEAVASQQSALEIAPRDHEPGCQQRLALYRKRVPFRFD